MTDPFESPVAGYHYLSVLCHQCGQMIPIAPDLEQNKAFHGLGSLQIGCPYCGQTHEYQPTEVKTRLLESAVPTAH